ncbi:MAG: dihydroorotate dehydrogenase-like protein [Rhodoplanes sp.]|uniref:dihydroorotate dehydrogenase-like protein n=1 Tax=Rhodoplanes sp. TaxID=1968906 RepID=UPI00181433B3|nr:dihydroorotate dehydrogenase-like protein [Rhodoplanes sp.]NVO16640.1 dihydroorotate dehydrogenase-like protein [Rhodoplanes sp.]
MSDLTTRYLGLTLKSPLVASASPLCDSIEGICRLADAGVAAVVLPSLFEEQLTLESLSVHADLERGTDTFAEAAGFFPDLHTYNLGPDGCLELIREAKRRVDIPVIASLNGVTVGGWIDYAKLMQEAGADALELNTYSIAVDPSRSAEAIEQGYVDLLTAIRAQVKIPVAVKLSPFFSAPANIARRLGEAGADALVLFNRFYQPDFDIEEREVVASLALSRPEELLMRLHWVAILHGRVKADLAITGGVHSAPDVVKSVMAGARVACMTSALLNHGPGYAKTVLRDLDRWLDAHEYESVQQMCGSMSFDAVPNPSAYERGNYMKVLSSYTLRDDIFA